MNIVNKVFLKIKIQEGVDAAVRLTFIAQRKLKNDELICLDLKLIFFLNIISKYLDDV